MREFQFDLLVIGAGPAGRSAAVQAAVLDKRVAIIEKRGVLGETCANTGTIPSATLREAVLHPSDSRVPSEHYDALNTRHHVRLENLRRRTNTIIRQEIDGIRRQLHTQHIELLEGAASFIDSHTIKLVYPDGHGHAAVSAQHIFIATGTEATRDPRIQFDGQRIFFSDEILGLEHLPRSLAIIGAGLIGCEYVRVCAALGIRVTLIDKEESLLPFLDNEIRDCLERDFKKNRIMLRLGEEVTNIEPIVNENGQRVLISLSSGTHIVAEKAMYSIGRTAATQSLNLQNAGLSSRLEVNDHYQTKVPHIYAVGDVIGNPHLASISMEQGRLAACHAFGTAAKSIPRLLPFNVYTIPEISFVGMTEQDLVKQGIPYGIGRGQYDGLPSGKILDSEGLVKLLFHRTTRELLGVHIAGESASELIHIGQAVMAFNGTIDYFVDAAFNYPTLAEYYKVAAADGINRVHGGSAPLTSRMKKEGSTKRGMANTPQVVL